jgi:voltage-dependent calcium channel
MEKLTQPSKTSILQESANKLQGKSLSILDPNNILRLFTKNIVLHPYFDPFIILIIIISTVMMAIDNPLNDPNG